MRSDTCVTRTRGEVVSVFGEGDGGDRTGVAGEVRHVGALLQVPNLDLRVGRAGSENQTVGVELSAGQSCGERARWRGKKTQKEV